MINPKLTHVQDQLLTELPSRLNVIALQNKIAECRVFTMYHPQYAMLDFLKLPDMQRNSNMT